MTSQSSANPRPAAARPETRAVLYRGGVIHSPTDPFAEALVVTDGTVSWLGSEDTVATLGEVGDVVLLDGALLAPAFVDARLVASRRWREDVQSRLAHGVASVHLVVPLDDDALVADVAEGQADAVDGDVRVVLQVPPTLAPRGPGGVEHRLAVVTGLAGPAPRRLTERLVALAVDATHPDLAGVVEVATGARLPVRVLVRTEDLVERVVDVLRGAGASGGSRLELAAAMSADAAQAIASAGLAVTVLGTVPAPLAALASAGVPLAFGSHPDQVHPGSPWEAVRVAVGHPDPAQRVSARAAFRAHTRGGWRAAGADHTGAGEIGLGAPAHLAAWEADVLAVQAPDGRLAAWSTDPRAGTPLLPALDDDHDLPRCRWVLVEGRRASPGGPGTG